LAIQRYGFKHYPTFAALSSKSPIQQNTSVQFQLTSLCMFKHQYKSSSGLKAEAENWKCNFSVA